MNLFIFNGLITSASVGDDSGVGISEIQKTKTFSGKTVTSTSPAFSIADWADKNIRDKKVTVRYAISERLIEHPDLHVQDFMEQVLGKANSAFYGNYSDLTGHLWTTERFNVGGHDIIKVLSHNYGNYIHMEIEVH